MSENDATAIREALHGHGDDLGFLAELPSDDSRRLIDDIEHAYAAHNGQIAAKLEESLSHVPRLLRGVLRKAFRI